MAWELRSNRPYYYRKRRCGTRVISEYIGPAPAAALAAELDAQRLAERRALHHDLNRQRAVDADLAAAEDALRTLVTALLLVGGYHQHKGQWRRHRER